MAEYIKQETVVNNLELLARHEDRFRQSVVLGIIETIRAMEAADVAPVVHTRWAHLGGDEWCCPVCGFVITTEGSWDKPTKKYCEDCGAKMDGGADHEAD